MWTDADVRVHAKTSLLHAHIAHLEVLEDLLEGAKVGAGVRGGPDIGFAHNLYERHSCPIEIDRGRARISVVNRFPRVLLHVQSRDPDLELGVGIFCGNRDESTRSKRLIELRDLVALREVGIEIVFAREYRNRIDLAPKAERGSRCQLDG